MSTASDKKEEKPTEVSETIHNDLATVIFDVNENRLFKGEFLNKVDEGYHFNQDGEGFLIKSQGKIDEVMKQVKTGDVLTFEYLGNDKFKIDRD